MGTTMVGPQAKFGRYLINTETRRIYAYSRDLANSKNPVFVPFNGTLPPLDLEQGWPLAPDPNAEPLGDTAEDRVRRIAGILPIVDPEEISENGNPSLPVVSKLAKVEKATRKEVNDAMAMRSEMMRNRSMHAEEKKMSEEDEQQPVA
jgi:hypothetical protein